MKSWVFIKQQQLLQIVTALVLIPAACVLAEDYSGASGTESDPYLIYDANDMNAIGANPSDWNKHLKLMADFKT